MNEEGRVTPETDSSQPRYVVLDVETTGLSVLDGHEICEIAAVSVEAGRIGEHFVRLVNPGRPIPPDATAINGITEEMVRDAPRFEEVLPDLLDFIGGDSVIVIHNAPFDMSFILTALMRAGRPLPSNLVVDTLELARIEFGSGGNSLGALAARLSLQQGTPHRAQGDTETTARLLLHLVNKLRDRGHLTLGSLRPRPVGYYARFAVSPAK